MKWFQKLHGLQSIKKRLGERIHRRSRSFRIQIRKNRTEPFQGASGATHPVLAEAVTQFQAQAYKELLPADGPVRTQVIGVKNPATEQQATRVKRFL